MEYFTNGRGSSSSSSGSSLTVQGEEDMTNLRRGPWTSEEDLLLANHIRNHGDGRWNSLARSAGLRRTGKSCRLRWLNYLCPDVRRGNITPQEQLLILQLHTRWGNRWSKIAKHMPGRTDNEIKNYWRTRVQKHAKQLKCDVNSQKFRDIVHYLWIPRLLERIHAGSGTAISAADAVQLFSRHHDASIPSTWSTSHDQLEKAAKVVVTPESSIDSPSPLVSAYTTGSCSYSDGDTGACSSALGWNLQEFLDLDGGWGFGSLGDDFGMSDNFWSITDDDVWSLHQQSVII